MYAKISCFFAVELKQLRESKILLNICTVLSESHRTAERRWEGWGVNSVKGEEREVNEEECTVDAGCTVFYFWHLRSILGISGSRTEKAHLQTPCYQNLPLHASFTHIISTQLNNTLSRLIHSFVFRLHSLESNDMQSTIHILFFFFFF